MIDRMLPEIGDWLSASWRDFRRRWGTLMAVAAVGGAAAAAGALAPLAPAVAASIAGAGSPWIAWGAALFVSLAAGTWLSAWAQAAVMRAAAGEEGAAEALGGAWRQTAAFAWVAGLVFLSIGGGFVLLLVPGLVLTALFSFAPFYLLSGEASGFGALELSFARTRPLLGPVLLRLLALWVVAAAPSWIPWIGWLAGPLWAPIGLVAGARLAADLKALTPSPQRPRGVRPMVIGLSLILVLTAAAAAARAGSLALAAYRAYASGELAAKAPDAATAQSLLAVLQGKGDEADARRAAEYAASLWPGKAP